MPNTISPVLRSLKSVTGGMAGESSISVVENDLTAAFVNGGCEADVIAMITAIRKPGLNGQAECRVQGMSGQIIRSRANLGYRATGGRLLPALTQLRRRL